MKPTPIIEIEVTEKGTRIAEVDEAVLQLAEASESATRLLPMHQGREIPKADLRCYEGRYVINISTCCLDPHYLVGKRFKGNYNY